jgi:hypothetical protein
MDTFEVVILDSGEGISTEFAVYLRVFERFSCNSRCEMYAYLLNVIMFSQFDMVELTIRFAEHEDNIISWGHMF